MTKPRKSLTELEQQFLSGDKETVVTNQVEQTKLTLIDKIMQTTAEKEPTVRFTVDLSEKLHHKLSVLALRSRKKKSEIVRFLLEEALTDIND